MSPEKQGQAEGPGGRISCLVASPRGGISAGASGLRGLTGSPAGCREVLSPRPRRALGRRSPGGAAAPSRGQGLNIQPPPHPPPASLRKGCLLQPAFPSLARPEQHLRALLLSLPAGGGGDAPSYSFGSRSSRARRLPSQLFWEGLFVLPVSSDQGSVVSRQGGWSKKPCGRLPVARIPPGKPLPALPPRSRTLKRWAALPFPGACGPCRRLATRAGPLRDSGVTGHTGERGGRFGGVPLPSCLTFRDA